MNHIQENDEDIKNLKKIEEIKIKKLNNKNLKKIKKLEEQNKPLAGTKWVSKYFIKLDRCNDKTESLNMSRKMNKGLQDYKHFLKDNDI